MKLEIISNEKESLEFIIEGERHTLPNLLKEKLAEKADADFVAYRLDHPLDTKARFILKAKNPKKLLESTIKEIQTELTDFQKAFEKAK
ncbi:MAG: RpoL/Rpb11 RNA polymerase subunit family protein [Candidatus ainarchaeum sp.]|nr:RpoL/Rpb11 RNA polymerase subunit family protein [Candidatus ainarchaeum sp.]